MVYPPKTVQTIIFLGVYHTFSKRPWNPSRAFIIIGSPPKKADAIGLVAIGAAIWGGKYLIGKARRDAQSVADHIDEIIKSRIVQADTALKNRLTQANKALKDRIGQLDGVIQKNLGTAKKYTKEVIEKARQEALVVLGKIDQQIADIDQRFGKRLKEFREILKTARKTLKDSIKGVDKVLEQRIKQVEALLKQLDQRAATRLEQLDTTAKRMQDSVNKLVGAMNNLKGTADETLTRSIARIKYSFRFADTNPTVKKKKPTWSGYWGSKLSNVTKFLSVTKALQNTMKNLFHSKPTIAFVTPKKFNRYKKPNEVEVLFYNFPTWVKREHLKATLEDEHGKNKRVLKIAQLNNISMDVALTNVPMKSNQPYKLRIQIFTSKAQKHLHKDQPNEYEIRQIARKKLIVKYRVSYKGMQYPMSGDFASYAVTSLHPMKEIISQLPFDVPDLYNTKLHARLYSPTKKSASPFQKAIGTMLEINSNKLGYHTAIKLTKRSEKRCLLLRYKKLSYEAAMKRFDELSMRLTQLTPCELRNWHALSACKIGEHSCNHNKPKKHGSIPVYGMRPRVSISVSVVSTQ